MEPFKQFTSDKQEVLAMLSRLEVLIRLLGELGVDVEEDMLKVASAVDAIQSDVLRIALLGAFSDGKTSVIAGWLGRVMEDMKIDIDESSERVQKYEPAGLPDRCEIVDTPGLFGDREHTVAGRQVLYEDETKRYISEAHLILYVVDATNPLKDSHSDIVRWLLRDLRKLSCTVFVINKMDEVTDLTEDVLFGEQSAIKRENLIGKLRRAASLTAAEVAQLRIVCIAANPNGRGLPFWFSKPEQYEARSRIGRLKAITREVLASNVPEVLRAKTGLDVVRDLVSRKLALVRAQLAELALYENNNRQETTRITQDIQRGRTEVKRLAAAMSEELRTMESQLLTKLRPLELEDLKAYLEDEIGLLDGEVGFKLLLRIKAVVDRYTEQATAVTDRIGKDIEIQLEAGASFVETFGGLALGMTGKALRGIQSLPTSVIRSGIRAGRDVLSHVTGITVKFMPWELMKLASTISKWAGPVAAVVQVVSELYEAYMAKEREAILQRQKDEIGGLIKGAFKQIYDLLRDDATVQETFAPQLKGFEEVLVKLQSSSEWIRNSQLLIDEIGKELVQLDPGVGVLSSALPGSAAIQG